jgi:hypothetical protein
MNKLNNLLLTCGKVAMMLVFVSSCGDEDADLTDSEKERRQELTFDLSGHYTGDNVGQQATTLAIVNENKFHDIRGTFTLGRELSVPERDELRLGLQSLDQRITQVEIEEITLKLRQKLQGIALGTGKTLSKRGGENVVLDAKGLESEIVLVNWGESFHDVSFTNSRETYFVEVKTYFTAVKADMTLNYNMTRNTDDEGATLDEHKGIFVTVNRKVYIGTDLDREQRVCTLELAAPVLKRQ